VTRIHEPVICLVTDRRRLAPAARTTDEELQLLEAFVADAIEAGVDLVQLRERDLPSRLLLRTVRALTALAAGSRTVVLVNDRVDVAIAAGAAGVHLRSDGPPVDRVRALAGDRLLGRSVHVGEDLVVHGGADYLLFGTVFETTSKEGPVAGLKGLEAATSGSRVPVLAIGGITPDRAGECRRAGAAGVAAIGVFLPEGRARGSLGVRRAVGELRAAMLE
jgi:thiamine-phosphate pyrophosphorylase